MQIVPALNCGGVERGTIDIAKALFDEGYGPFVLTTGGALCPAIKSIPATLIKQNVSTKNPIKIYKNISFIENLIKEHGIDLVHARSRAPAWSAYYAAKRTNKPFVTTFHGIYNLKSKFKRYYNSVMTFGNRVIAVSDFVKDHIIKNYGVDESIIRVIHRGVDLDYFSQENIEENKRLKLLDKYNIPASTPIIIMPSRMTSWKGQHVLIEALKLIKDQDFYCMLVGDLSKHPCYVRRLKDMISSHKLLSKVHIFGSEIDMVGLYNLADIVISASIEPEAFGRTIVEAQAMKKLVIATNNGGAGETIIDTETGFLVNPNDPIELSEKIKYSLGILGSSKEDLIINQARQNVSENFSLKKMQQDTLSVYSELL